MHDPEQQLPDEHSLLYEQPPLLGGLTGGLGGEPPHDVHEVSPLQH